MNRTTTLGRPRVLQRNDVEFCKMTIHITAHAIDRYLERIERCTRTEARDRLLHAVQISERCSAAFVHAVSRKRGIAAPMQRDASYRYCPVESLLLVLHARDGAFHLVTVRRCESPEELAAKRRRKRKGRAA